jgi:hypothetical protein
MSISISSHEVVSETISITAEHSAGTEWVKFKWKDVKGARSSITLFIADNDARNALEQFARQILNATIEFEVNRELQCEQ